MAWARGLIFEEGATPHLASGALVRGMEGWCPPFQCPDGPRDGGRQQSSEEGLATWVDWNLPAENALGFRVLTGER